MESFCLHVILFVRSRIQKRIIWFSKDDFIWQWFMWMTKAHRSFSILLGYKIQFISVQGCTFALLRLIINCMIHWYRYHYRSLHHHSVQFRLSVTRCKQMSKNKRNENSVVEYLNVTLTVAWFHGCKVCTEGRMWYFLARYRLSGWIFVWRQFLRWKIMQ